MKIYVVGTCKSFGVDKFYKKYKTSGKNTFGFLISDYEVVYVSFVVCMMYIQYQNLKINLKLKLLNHYLLALKQQKWCLMFYKS